MRTIKLACLTLVLGLTLAAAGTSFAQTTAHANQIYGTVTTEDRSTSNIFNKHAVVLVRKYDASGQGPVVATGKVIHRHYIANMGDAPAGKYVVEIKPGGEYGGGQTLVDYPGPGGNYHQSWTIAVGQPAVPGKE
ncbi:MAG: hypothetical protein ABSG46_18320 [Candidatus Binataceae bacterium]|jgi:hypothetical protein